MALLHNSHLAMSLLAKASDTAKPDVNAWDIPLCPQEAVGGVVQVGMERGFIIPGPQNCPGDNGRMCDLEGKTGQGLECI
jgi:hypothetical protein